MSERLYHIGFGPDDLPEGTTLALLSGDPGRSEAIAMEYLDNGAELARNRGLDSFVGTAARRPAGRVRHLGDGRTVGQHRGQ